MLGGWLGLTVGRRSDILFGVDGGIAGIVSGAVLGSLLFRHPRLGVVIHAASAALGVIMPAFEWWSKGTILDMLAVGAALGSSALYFVLVHFLPARCNT